MAAKDIIHGKRYQAERSRLLVSAGRSAEQGKICGAAWYVSYRDVESHH